MAGDLNREASELWNSLKPIIDKEIDARTQGMVQRRKAKVTTAPSLATNTIGVTEPFGTEMFLPFNTNIMSASVGDFVWVEYMYGMTNAFVSMFASADDKNQYVAGNLTVDGVLDVTPRRCLATLSSPGWYRVLTTTGQGLAGRSWMAELCITRTYSNANNEVHSVKLMAVYDSFAFTGENSKTNTLGVDKIRYTRNGTTGYVDIHYSLSNANIVAVDFNIHVRQDTQTRFTANSLESVADSPSEETVLTEYDLNANGAYFNDLSVGGDLDVDGSATFDSGVTIGGVLAVTNCRAAANTVASAGWHRVLEFAPNTVSYRLGRAGIIIDFDITRYGTTNETHQISLSLIETNAKFYGEFSNSNTQLIDKIRYTYDSSKGYVDIHLSSAFSANVSVDYQVAVSAGSFRGLINTKSLAEVDASPSGETVLTEYAFNANGMGDLNVNGTVAGQGFADLLFGIGNSIPSNTNCNSLTSEGKYTCASVTIAGTLTNSPYTDSAFGMLVIRVAEAQRLVQVAMPNNATITVKLRYYNGSVWTAWKTITPS